MPTREEHFKRKRKETEYDKEVEILKGELFTKTRFDPSSTQTKVFYQLVEKHWKDLNTKEIKAYIDMQK